MHGPIRKDAAPLTSLMPLVARYERRGEESERTSFLGRKDTNEGFHMEGWNVVRTYHIQGINARTDRYEYRRYLTCEKYNSRTGFAARSLSVI